MKQINIFALCIIFLMSGACSSTWHLKKAIKKNPSIVTNKVDTLKIVIPGETKTIYAKDSIIVNEPGVFIRVTASGDSLQMFYEFLPDTIIRIQTQTVYNTIKTRQEIRLEAKKERLQLRKSFKTHKVQQKETQKTQRAQIKAESKPTAMYLMIGILIGFIAGMLLRPRHPY